MTKRGEILERIAAFQEPLEPLLAELRKFGWDCDAPHFVMTTTHVRSILERYLRGELTFESVVFWAECFEVREDVGFEDKGGVPAEIIFCLANPEINEPITKDLVAKLIRKLIKDSQQGLGGDHQSRAEGAGLMAPQG